MKDLLQRLVEAQASRRPDAPAVVFKQEIITYGELEERSNRLARMLHDIGCERGDRVVLLLPKSIPAVVGMLGTLKADAIYVPIGTDSPPARVARMLDTCESRCVLAVGATSRLLEEALSMITSSDGARVGWMEPKKPTGRGFDPDFSLDDLESRSPEPVDCRNTGVDVAHLLFTSGSTGIPKGVMITHENVMRFVEWANRQFGTSPTDRISCHPPLHFDLSTFDIYGCFAAGAQLHLVPPEANLLPHRLADFIRDSELTQWFSVPSILARLAKFDAVRERDFPTLKRLLWCGEVFPTPALIYWMRRLPEVSFSNLYGPTETTIASSYYVVPACPENEKACIPIGKACDGEELLVLDKQLRPVTDGQVGDLYIRGVGLSPGYWKDPEKTRSVFVNNPHSADPSDRLYKTGDLARMGEDGLVYLIGRADTQVKSRGYRIELGEIESALSTIEQLDASAVVAIETEGFEGKLICCAYVAHEGADVSSQELRKSLSRSLPHYMIPARWMRRDSMPYNANGKIDRPRLREEFLAGDKKVDEAVVAEVRRIVADNILVPVDSNETDLVESGAIDSVSLVELLVQLEQAFEVNFELETLELDDLRTIDKIAGMVSEQKRVTHD